jgi:hypothetical protein
MGTASSVDPRMVLLGGHGHRRGCCKGDGPEISELLLQVLSCPLGRSRGERECFRGLKESGAHVIGSA